jgi:hypothetical protein
MTKPICRTCCREIDQPWRVVENGAITMGCVAADHDDQLSGADLVWHLRPAARQARAMMRSAMRSLLASA